jgi:branched-chain amino acid transport system permease protein
MKRLRVPHVALLAGLLVAVLFPFFFSPYQNGQLTLVIVYAVALVGLNLIGGYTGQITVGQVFFFGLGGYTTAILVADTSVPAPVALVAAGLVGMVAAWLIGMPVLRLSGFYLTVVTLALVFVLAPVVKRWDSLTGGSAGKSPGSPQVPGSLGLAQDQWIYFVCLAVALVMFALASTFVRSQYGPAMIAIRERELVAEAIGIDTSRLKTRVFALSGLFAGVGGALYVFAIGFVAPDSFGMALALQLFVAAFVGGFATVGGAIVGALFIQYVPQVSTDISEGLTGVLFGASLILCLLLMPHGIVGRWQQLVAGRRRGIKTYGTINQGEGT